MPFMNLNLETADFHSASTSTSYKRIKVKKKKILKQSLKYYFMLNPICIYHGESGNESWSNVQMQFS